MSLARRAAMIEAEFGEPIRDVLAGFRAQGCEWNTVAGALGISYNALWRLRRHVGAPVDKATIREVSVRSAVRRRVEEQARSDGFGTVEEAIRCMRLTRCESNAEIAAHFGIHLSTLQKYTPRELFGKRVNLSDASRARSRELMRALNAKRAQDRHRQPWKDTMVRP